MSNQISLTGNDLHSDFAAEVGQLQRQRREGEHLGRTLQEAIDELAKPENRKRGGSLSMIVSLAEMAISNRQSVIAAIKGAHGIKKDRLDRRMKALVKEAELGRDADQTSSAVTHELLKMLQEQLRRNNPSTPIVDADFQEVDVDAMIDERLGPPQALIEAPKAPPPPPPPEQEGEEAQGDEQPAFGDRIADADGRVYFIDQDGAAVMTKETAKVFKDDDGYYAVLGSGERVEVYDMGD